MNSKTKTIVVTAALVAVIAGICLWRQFQAHARLQAELDTAQKQAATLNAHQHKLETQLASQALDLQIQQAQAQSSSSSGVGGVRPMNVSGPAVNPRAPLPGVYPNRPKFSDLQAAMAAGQLQFGEPYIRSMYANLFQKMQFTPEQIDAFVKIQLDARQQRTALLMANPIDPASMSNLTLTQKQAALDQHDQQSQAQLQALDQATAAQVQPLLGSADNVSYYQDYTADADQRMAVINGYEPALDAAGLPPLTLDQEEQLASLAYQNILKANSDQAQAIQQFPQVLQQAGGFLTPEQVQVLQQFSQQLTSPHHESGVGG